LEQINSNQQVSCAIISAKAKKVKKFLRVWCKLFQNTQVFLRQSAKPTRPRASIRAKATNVKKFLRGRGKLAQIAEVSSSPPQIEENCRKLAKNP